MQKEMQMQKTREKKMNSERMFLEQQQRTIQKQAMMEEREKFRRAVEEQRNYEKKIENAKVKEYQEGKINQMKMFSEFKIQRQRQEIEKKETLVEQRKKFFEMQSKQKGSDLSGSFDALNPRKEDLVKMMKMKNQYDQMMKSNSIIQKLDQVDNNIKWKQQMSQQMLNFKSEINNQKREEFKNNMKKKEKTQEYYKEMNMRKLREKEERAYQLKNYKQDMLNYKKGVQEENSKQKKQVMELFDKMMKNSNSISPEVIMEMFPGEQALIHKLMKLKEVTRSTSPMARSSNDYSQALNNSF